MKQALQVLSVIMLIAVFSSCSPRMLVSQASISTVQPALGEPYYPLTARTSIEEIDRVLDAIGDIQKRRRADIGRKGTFGIAHQCVAFARRH